MNWCETTRVICASPATNTTARRLCGRKLLTTCMAAEWVKVRPNPARVGRRQTVNEHRRSTHVGGPSVCVRVRVRARARARARV